MRNSMDFAGRSGSDSGSENFQFFSRVIVSPRFILFSLITKKWKNAQNSQISAVHLISSSPASPRARRRSSRLSCSRAAIRLSSTCVCLGEMVELHYWKFQIKFENEDILRYMPCVAKVDRDTPCQKECNMKTRDGEVRNLVRTVQYARVFWFHHLDFKKNWQTLLMWLDECHKSIEI